MSAAPNNPPGPIREDPAWLRRTLIALGLGWLALFLVLPLVVVFHAAFSKGLAVYWASLADPNTLSAVTLTLIAAAVAVVLNTIFGVAAAWAVTRFDFPGKSLLVTLIDLPFAVSPVIAGLIYVLLFGRLGWFGARPLFHLWPWLYGIALLVAAWAILPPLIARLRGQPSSGWVRVTLGVLIGGAVLLIDAPLSVWLQRNDVQVLFAVPGIVLATVFITFPFVARELIPLMESLGTEEEEAAITLGAGGWRTFWLITLPNIKWGLLYGIILCNARAMGEFGAVSVVSGHIRGLTNTIPLHVEILYNEYQYAAAFAVASILALLALITLVLKSLVEWRADRHLAKRGI